MLKAATTSPLWCRTGAATEETPGLDSPDSSATPEALMSSSTLARTWGSVMLFGVSLARPSLKSRWRLASGRWRQKGLAHGGATGRNAPHARNHAHGPGAVHFADVHHVGTVQNTHVDRLVALPGHRLVLSKQRCRAGPAQDLAAAPGVTGLIRVRSTWLRAGGSSGWCTPQPDVGLPLRHRQNRVRKALPGRPRRHS
jgi:hypothetical protein